MNTDPKLSVSTTGSAQSLALGQRLASVLKLGDVVELVGDLGGGKTTFVKGIAAGLGVVQVVTSPTYNIQRNYKLPAGGQLEHYDLYRLGDDEILLQEMREVIEAGDSIICVEWADRFSTHLTDDRFVIELHVIPTKNEEEREVIIRATGSDTKQRLHEAADKLKEVAS